MKFNTISVAVFMAFVSLSSCSDDDSNKPAVRSGSCTFYATSDLGVGPITISIENAFSGKITHYHPSGVRCGNGDVNIYREEGTYAWTASGIGRTWTGTVVITGGECRHVQIRP